MALNKVVVVLEQPEYSALLDMAVEELRNPSDQMRMVLRQELKRRGLLSQDDQRKAERNGYRGRTPIW